MWRYPLWVFKKLCEVSTCRRHFYCPSPAMSPGIKATIPSSSNKDYRVIPTAFSWKQNPLLIRKLNGARVPNHKASSSHDLLNLLESPFRPLLLNRWRRCWFTQHYWGQVFTVWYSLLEAKMCSPEHLKSLYATARIVLARTSVFFPVIWLRWPMLVSA